MERGEREEEGGGLSLAWIGFPWLNWPLEMNEEEGMGI